MLQLMPVSVSATGSAVPSQWTVMTSRVQGLLLAVLPKDFAHCPEYLKTVIACPIPIMKMSVRSTLRHRFTGCLRESLGSIAYLKVQ